MAARFQAPSVPGLLPGNLQSMPKRKHDSESEEEPSAASTGASSEDEKPAKRVKKQESSKKATKKETKPKPAKVCLIPRFYTV